MKRPFPEKICVVCNRSFTWRKKWERVWDQVKYCSKRCSGQRSSALICDSVEKSLTSEDIERVIRMAWEDRTPFDAIEEQFGLDEAKTIQLMRRELRPQRFSAWRKRVHENGNLKNRDARGFQVGRFKSKNQRIDGSIKSK
ncbi:MAG: TIGR03643 family protein [Bdellovibrionia bacterium]